MEFEGKKYYHVFTAGNYPQADISEEMLQEIARNYNPANFHEAPVWLGHPDDNQNGNSEPEALAWIDSVIAVGDKLYVSFSHVSDKMKQLVNNQMFKRVSVEIVQYKSNDGKKFPYLFAVGLTNRPAVKGLPPIQFAGKKYNSHYEAQYLFNESFQNNPTNTMNPFLINIAKALQVDVSKFVADESLSAAITQKLTELQKPAPAPSPDVDKSSKAEIESLKAQLEQFEDERIANLVDGAIKDMKILPAHRAQYVGLAKANFKLAATTIEGLPVHKDLAEKQVDTSKSVNMEDPKFKSESGQKLTYEEYLKLPAEKQASFNDEEVIALQAQSKFARK